MDTTDIPLRRILVVDDEPLVCEAVKAVLRFDGHEVETAGNGKEALALYEQGKFDVIITDYSMPQMRGDELANAIKARTPDQRIIMITAYAETMPASNNRLAAVDSLVSKPFRLEDLREAIATVLAD
jgi:CheY-like chemotaxis protein